MDKHYYIEDETHADILGRYKTFDKAFEELEKISRIPFGHEPNIPPCTSGMKCDRDYYINQYFGWEKTTSAHIFCMSQYEIVWYDEVISDDKNGDKNVKGQD